MELKVSKSFYKKLDRLEEAAEDALRDKLNAVANDAVNYTLMSTSKKGKTGAVDTGAYITSFSFAVGAGRPRGKSSKNKTRNVSASSVAGLARAQLQADISRADLKSSTRITLRNASPHAYYVEHKHGYKIFAQLRRKHG